MSDSFTLRRVGSYVFIGGLALLFALEWGPGSRGCNKTGTADPSVATAAATVNGKEIPLTQFNRAFASRMQMFRGQNLPPGILKQLGIQNQVVDELVADELLAQAAESRGVIATDQELLEQLRKQPVFQKDGHFDYETYRSYLRDYDRRTDVEFEKEMRRSLSKEKLLGLVEATAMVSDDEVKARYQKEGNKAKVTFVKFDPNNYVAKVGVPKPEELKKWTAEHEADITTHYDKKKTLEYFVPEKVHARHIVIRTSEGDDKTKSDDAKLKIENVRKEILAGKDFSEMAKQLSEDPTSKDKGGDLGWVDRASLPPTLSDALFPLAVGEVTQAVKTAQGWHIAKVEEKKPPETKPLETVKADIARELWVKAKSQALAKTDADAALAAVNMGKKLADLYPLPEPKDPEKPGAAGAGPEKPAATQTGEFNSGAGLVPSLDNSAEVLTTVFRQDATGALQQVFNLNNVLVVATVDELAKPNDAEFEKQKATLKNEAIKGKQFELREAFVKSLKSTGTVVVNTPAVDKAMGDS